MELKIELVEQAYKKLKSSVYYDKTALVLRNRIVEMEMQYPGEELDKYLRDTIYEALNDKEKFKKLQETICSKISVRSFPKKLNKEDRKDILFNATAKETIVSELQHYIDMPVEGHILGVLWIMIVGCRLEDVIYEHSYGNRIRKNLINEFSEQPTYSPYLFEPYFEQYESWRDKAMSEAQKHMGLKQDVVILTMDFRRYYYSLNVDHDVMKCVLNEARINYDERLTKCGQLLNDFIENVILVYSKKFDEEFGGKRILPIGFLPSNIIGNWCLKRFDKAIVDGWNPVYYGRYVDDILIVDKVERNGEIYRKVESGELNKEDIIEFFLTRCSKWSCFKQLPCECAEKYALLLADRDHPIHSLCEENRESECENIKYNSKDIEDEIIYTVNPRYNPESENNTSEIVVQNNKVKIFYFKWDESDSLITCFKNNISRNKSEFRHLPEDEAVFQRDDYSDIYSLSNNDTVNKFRSIEDIALDKYKLSKFLGKYLRIGGLIHDKAESRFERDILKIFNSSVIIENYMMWEKVIEILVINEHFKSLEIFCGKINEAIDNIKIGDENITVGIKENVSRSLYEYLHAGLCRSLALVWTEERAKTQEGIYKSFLKKKLGFLPDESFSSDELIKGYYESRMIDKSVMPIFIEMIDGKELDVSSDVNLSDFGETYRITKDKWKSSGYKYYPYLINMYDIDISSCLEQMNLEETRIPFSDLSEILENAKQKYCEENYQKGKEDCYVDNLICVTKFSNDEKTGKAFVISVGNAKKKELRIAIANVRLDHKNFENAVKGIPNRSYTRYEDLSKIVNAAIDENVDMLIMPEAYVPFEWLSVITRTCAKNNIAIVAGVEHIIHSKKIRGKEVKCVYNFTAVILPYTEDSHKCAHITFHLKKHYAPSEIELIKGYRMIPVCGHNYELYRWNDCYFPVYCCYELTSISDRSLFQSYADMIVAVEWNKDVKYYSNILESLSRDIHCYCVQVNLSEYGDSRITKPSKSEEKDIIRTKGGVNGNILIDSINIAELRDFQIKEYTLQKSDGRYKTTPPNFDKEIVLRKIKGEEVS